MGLFDEISGMVTGLVGGNATDQGSITQQLMGVLQQNGVSGVSGIIQQFENSGMGAHAASWIGNGSNLPISAQQVEQALGNPLIASIAAKFGIDTSTAATMLAQHLPAAVDQATPDGTVPSNS